jgi:glycosyltransferase involved in cell wall biosynthesis
MRIAVDATAVRSLNHGIGTYVANLLVNLVEVELDNFYLVYMNRAAIRDYSVLAFSPDRIHFAPVTSNRPLRLLQEQLLMSRSAAGRNAALFWGCHNTLPAVRACPQVVTIHDLGMITVPQFYPRAKVAYFRWAITRAVERAAVIVAVSEFTRAELVRVLGVPETRIKVVLCGIGSQFRRIDDSERITYVRHKYRLPAQYIFALGVPEPKKNLERLILAYAELKRIRRDAPRLVIGGGRSYGWQNGPIFRTAETLRDDVLFTDFITHDELPIIYSLADMFVFPSLYEGFGVPPIEAMACGAPVITSNAASLPEVTGGAALLVNPLSEEEITAAMVRLLDDAQLRMTLRERGLANAQRFNWRSAASKMIGIFREAAEAE